METNQRKISRLPAICNLTLAYILSLLVAALMVFASVAGLLYRTNIYPTDELLQSFVPSDIVNLLVGLPILIASLFLVGRGKLIGLLLWPGALFYVFYTYLIYIFSLPFNLAFLMHIALVTLSAYIMVGLITCIDGKAVQTELIGVVKERIGGGILAGLGLLFLLRVLFVMVSSLVNQIPIGGTELALHVADFLISPAMIIGGLLLWRRKPLGYTTGLGLLFQASMLFIGLIFALILQPFTTDTPFKLIDVMVVFVMGFVSFIPFSLFVHGIALKNSSTIAEVN